MSKSKRDVQLQALLANPHNSDLNCTLDFCVDTGSTMTVIPRRVAKKLKLKIVGKVGAKIAGGKLLKFDMAYIYLYVTGEGLMVYAAITEGPEALLGCDIMELLQFQIDVAKKKILRPVRRFQVVSMLIKVTGKRICEILSNKR